jgi:hypothetical protein
VRKTTIQLDEETIALVVAQELEGMLQLLKGEILKHFEGDYPHKEDFEENVLDYAAFTRTLGWYKAK